MIGGGREAAPVVSPETAGLPAGELLWRFRRRELSPVEVISACLEAIERLDELV